MTEFQKENIRRWVEALRSGKYKQRKYLLVDDNCFCVTGLACEVGGIPQADHGGAFIYENVIYNTSPPWPWFEWYYGFRPNELFDNEGTPDCLINMNDHGMPFDQIADIIESKFL